MPALIEDATLDRATFLREHLRPRRPVLVRGALADWPWSPPWPLETLADRFGDCRVPLYDSLFALQGVTTFGRYVERFTGTDAPAAPPYLRWFARQGPEELPWADEAFAALAADWWQPRWLPDSGYLFPRTTGPVDAATDPFPARGLFVCGRGGRTRLHADPWHSDACLCQTTGEKRIVLFAPAAAELLSDREGTVDLDDPDDARFPRHRDAVPALDDVLRPGDAVYIPAGWLHTAVALSDSCSLTWNFVHDVHERSFTTYLRRADAVDSAVTWFCAPRAGALAGRG